MAFKQQHQAFLIILLSFLILLGLQFGYEYLPFLNPKFKNSRFFTYYLKEDPLADTANGYIDSTIIAQLDTSITDPEEDSIIKTTLPALKKLDEKFFASDTFQVPAYANVGHLSKFFTALKKKKKSRVGYWGDSTIEGDLITQTLRRKLQDAFGGSGVGFVPMISYTAGFRSTITHEFGGGWRYFSLIKTPKKKAPYSLAGEYMMAYTDTTGKNAWAIYTLPKKEAATWDEVHLIYGKGSGKGKVFARLNKETDTAYTLKDTAAINLFSLKKPGLFKCTYSFTNTGSTPLYGVSLESSSGIILDNFSLRGNSGMPLIQIPENILVGFREKMGYDLIVLQFGSNVVNAKTMDYRFYEDAMTKVVRHFQAAFPDAAIVIMGVADKGIKKDGEMVSDPAVRRVLKAQYKAALKTGVCFYNIYEAMGGANSMATWADAEKPLANKDYTHFNFRGADKIGKLFFEFIMSNYRAFEKVDLLD